MPSGFPRPRGPRRALGPALGLLVALAFAGCQTGPPAPAAVRLADVDRANLVLVTVDTLRADRLGCYGSDDVETPHIDELAKNGVLFERTASTVPLTLPAHASILTGTYPFAHGIRDNGGYYLAPEHVTLAETLEARGYATGAFIGAFVLDSRWGLDQGFEHYGDDLDFAGVDEMSLGAVQRPGNEVLEDGLQWLEQVREAPFFVWLHLYDPHAPYEPPEPHRSRYAEREWGAYDGEVAFVDELVGRLVAWIEASGLVDRTAIVLVGDHGESLGEHGEQEHGFFVYDATMRVPMILSAPHASLRGRRVTAQTRVIDLMPTLLDLLGLEIPEGVEGLSLRPLLSGEKSTLELAAYGETFFPLYHYGWSPLRSLRRDGLHFIEAPTPEVYDLEADPGEENNLATERPDLVHRLRQELDALVASEPIGAGEAQAMDADTERRLAALGYTGGMTRPRAGRDFATLADPKDKIALYQLVTAAEADAGAGRVEPALSKLERALSEDPEVVRAHVLAGDLYQKRGDLARAAAAFEKAVALDPSSRPARFRLATVELARGRGAEAERGLQRVLELDPRDNKSYFLLAKLFLGTRRHERALDTVERAIEHCRDVAPFHVLRADALLGLGDVSRARSAVETALEMQPRLPRAYDALGRIEEAEGNLEAALRAYEKEIELFPFETPTFFRLAALHQKRGSLEDALQVLRELVEEQPTLAEAHVVVAQAYLESGQPEPALRHAERALGLGPRPALASVAQRVAAEAQRQQSGRFP